MGGHVGAHAGGHGDGADAQVDHALGHGVYQAVEVQQVFDGGPVEDQDLHRRVPALDGALMGVLRKSIPGWDPGLGRYHG